LTTQLTKHLPFFFLDPKKNTSKKYSTALILLVYQTDFVHQPTKATMADCGCAPKCACGAEKIGELLFFGVSER